MRDLSATLDNFMHKKEELEEEVDLPGGKNRPKTKEGNNENGKRSLF